MKLLPNPRLLASNLAWWLYAAGKVQNWRRATWNVHGAQAEVLRRIVQSNRSCAFGREHDFHLITTVEEFRNRVPIRCYEEFEPYIDRAAQGEPQVLTLEPVLHFGLSSGTTTASKRIPYTASLVQEFQEGIEAWAYHLFLNSPRLLGGTTYWSITPVGAERRTTPAGIPLGFDDERTYLSPLARRVMEAVMPAPSALARIEDREAFRYATLRLLLEQESLGWVSVWNPTFLTLLLEPLLEWKTALISDLERGTLSLPEDVPLTVRRAVQHKICKAPGRASRLRRLFQAWEGRPATDPDDRNRTLYEEIWPNLRLISCWAHGAAKEVLPLLRRLFPNVAVQPKGVLATEAFISFPYRDGESALSATSHFFEFEEQEAQRRVRSAHEVEVGKSYSLIITTSGGLYRYRLGDVVEVTGFVRTCPLLHFVGKEDKVVDLRGEKLNEAFVQRTIPALLECLGIHPNFWMVGPCNARREHAGYILFLQCPDLPETLEISPDTLARRLDEALRENYHYDYCRRLGQLRCCRLFLIHAACDAPGVYLTTCAGLGQRLGDIKPAALHPSDRWEHCFQGRFFEGAHEGRLADREER
jgi:hypothetical protein